MNPITKSTGIALALVAAGLASGCNYTKSDSASDAGSSNVRSDGVNKCGGHNECKTAGNDCNSPADH